MFDGVTDACGAPAYSMGGLLTLLQISIMGSESYLNCAYFFWLLQKEGQGLWLKYPHHRGKPGGWVR